MDEFIIERSDLSRTKIYDPKRIKIVDTIVTSTNRKKPNSINPIKSQTKTEAIADTIIKGIITSLI